MRIVKFSIVSFVIVLSFLFSTVSYADDSVLSSDCSFVFVEEGVDSSDLSELYVLPFTCVHKIHVDYEALTNVGVVKVRVHLWQDVEIGAFCNCMGLAMCKIEFQTFENGDTVTNAQSRMVQLGHVEIFEDFAFPPSTTRCKFKVTAYALESPGKIGKLMSESDWFTIYC